MSRNQGNRDLQQTLNQRVVGSSPTGGTHKASRSNKLRLAFFCAETMGKPSEGIALRARRRFAVANLVHHNLPGWRNVHLSQPGDRGRQCQRISPQRQERNEKQSE
jgi:hypothetical protein